MGLTERAKRSRLCQLAQGGGLIHGSLVKMARTCGNPGCRCTRQGRRHVSWYLAVSINGRKRMLYLASTREEAVKAWVKRYQEIRQLLEDLSELHWRKLRQGEGM